jgi:hypothetical protein
MKLKFAFTIRLILLVSLMMNIVSLTMSSAAVVRPSAPDVRFASGKSALRIPFRLHNNLIYLQVSVNNSKPLWFILDTGASYIVDTRQARALGLQLGPPGLTGGVGEGKVEVSTTGDITFRLPGVTLSGQTVAVLLMESVEECTNRITADSRGAIVPKPKSAGESERQVIDGVLGHQLFTRFVVEIDYARQYINLYEPRGYKYSGGGEIIPLEIADRHIFVRSQITLPGRAPLMGRFMIDTGAATALVLNSPFIKTNNLIPVTQPAIPFTGCGIGGDTRMLISTVGGLRLGSLNIVNPVTMFSQSVNGVLASSDFDGLIGSGILRHYKLVFDYSRRRMILETVPKGAPLAL